VEADHAVRGRGARQCRELVVVCDHVVPPRLLEVTLELDAERPVVPAAVQTPINLAARKNEPATLAQRDELLHQVHVISAKRGACRKRASIASAPSLRARAAADEAISRAAAAKTPQKARV